MNASSDTIVIQFAKSPAGSNVKTRLASVLDQDQRLDLHRAMTSQVCAQLSPNLHYQLWVAGDTEHDLFRQLTDTFSISLHQQQGSDLGERMAHALALGLTRYAKALVVGSDCPFIDNEYIDRALRQLDEYDVVIGPADDGGYVLIGMKTNQPQLFTDIPWGSDNVLTATTNKLDGASVSYTLLDSLPDIDRPEDLALLNNPVLPESLRQFSQVANNKK